jgi:hypothetical protein
MANSKVRTFKDISLSFKPHPVTGDIMTLSREKAIQRSVRNLVQTGVRERFYSELGTDVTDSLFGFVDFATAGVIANQIIDLLKLFERRIDNVRVITEPRPDNNEFEVQVSYTIIGEDPIVQTYSYILEATR